MLAKADEYLAERANEQQLLKDTYLEEILIDDLDAGLKIVMSCSIVKPRRQIHGLGDGLLQDIDTSSNVRYMEKVAGRRTCCSKAKYAFLNIPVFNVDEDEDDNRIITLPHLSLVARGQPQL
ncbi:Uncharacterized protein Adt_03720 [Abeliophyllum distichum]|uniref:Uncharacterized protein n=1 Tax=Abeliophyllum distichum TaxID=126358 RepID=A0ABD1VZA0_9LAMI